MSINISERVGLFAGCAPGAPNPDAPLGRTARDDLRQHVVAKGFQLRTVAEEVRLTDRQRRDERLDAPGDARSREGSRAARLPAAGRRPRAQPRAPGLGGVNPGTQPADVADELAQARQLGVADRLLRRSDAHALVPVNCSVPAQTVSRFITTSRRESCWITASTSRDRRISSSCAWMDVSGTVTI